MDRTERSHTSYTVSRLPARWALGTFARVLVVGLVFCLSASASAQDYATPAEAKAMAEKAAALIEEIGLSDAYAHLSDPRGEYFDRDLYVFVLDLNGFLLVHPDPAAVGANAILTQDPEGNFFVREIVERARRGETGFWVDYIWIHPQLGTLMPKQSWNIRIGDLVVGCGAYPGFET